jgi:hypothetical protein
MTIRRIKIITLILVALFAFASIVSAAFIAPIPYFYDLHYSSSPTPLGLVEMIAYLVCSLAVYYLLFVAGRTALSMKGETLLIESIARPAKRAGIVLLCGSIMFTLFFFASLIARATIYDAFHAENAYEAIVSTLGFEFACVIIVLIGIAISVAILTFAKALMDGERYKQDSEAIV